MMIIEMRTDGGDFAEIWVNGQLAVDLCSDTDDIETALKVVNSVAGALVTVSVDHGYTWDDILGRLSKT